MNLSKCIIVLIFASFSQNLWAQKEYIDFCSENNNGLHELIDSLLNTFNTTNSNVLKQEAALQLFDEFNFTEKRVQVLSKKLNLDTSVVNSWKHIFRKSLVNELEILEDPKKRIEYKLLSAQTISEYNLVLNELKKIDIEPEIDSLFKGIIIQRTNHLSYVKKEIKHKRNGIRKALELVPRKPSNQFIFNSLCSQMGLYHYQNQELDSAEFYYRIITTLFEKDKSIKYTYIPGYGVNNRKEFVGSSYMNLGLIYERKGNLVKATSYYKKANQLFGNQKGFSKQWSEMRLMNAFLDIGDETSGLELLRQMATDNFEYLRPLKRYGPHILISVISEFDLDQIKEHAPLIDSIMQAEVNFFYFDKEQNETAKNTFYFASKSSLAIYDLIFQRVISSRTRLFDVAELQKAYESFPSPTKNHTSKYSEQKNLVAIYFLASKIISKPNQNSLTDELISLFANENVISTNLQALRSSSYLFNVYEIYEAELSVLNKIIPYLEKTSHIVELSKCYKQIANCYEQLGSYKSAIKYRKKHEIIATEIRQQNQHSNLAKLDKELQVSRALHEKQLAEKENQALTVKKNKLILTSISVAIISALLFALLYLNRKRILAERQRLSAQNEILESNLELEAEKAKRASLEVVKGNQSLSQLITDVEQFKTQLSHANKKRLLGLLVEHKSKTNDESWIQFKLDFDEKYSSFFQNLSNNYKLTENERRICAMHLSGLDNKQINAITGQKLSSIHTMKSKIRKKLDVDNDEQLAVLLKTIND
ncbi:MAG: hypothetical protein JXQ87_08235 [Bacteroidia bacterium]